MYIKNKQPLFLLGVNLLLLVSAIIMLTNLYISNGISPLWLLILVLSFLFTFSLFRLINVQNNQTLQVIRALANGDSTLGFSTQHPMQNYYQQIKDKMQLARFEAEHQSEFLKALLIHIDLAVIVCNAKGQVVNTNPAVARLLGRSIKHLNDLNKIGTIVVNADKNLRSTVQWENGEQLDTLTLQLSIANIQGNEYKIVTLQSIHEVLVNKEQQAYKRLTQVLTHEVANTITPLASIAQTCQSLLPNDLSFVDLEEKQDLDLALTTLAKRTEYLGEFIASFRHISSLPIPQLAPVDIALLLQRIATLHQQQLKENNINLVLDIQSQQLIMLDSCQIEQVIINLIKNAIEAINIFSKQGSNLEFKKDFIGNIELIVAKNSAQQLYVEVYDNGAGIPEHVIDMVFVPFFTTKQQGSGIGLSLSKQIMVNHGGDLVYITREQGACFRCIFG